MFDSYHCAYLANGMLADRWWPAGFGDPKAREQCARLAANGPNSPPLPLLIEALEEQERELPDSPVRQDNLSALAKKGTAVVATGQQVGLFLGPLYTVYKAATAIAVSRQLTAETQVRCVPLFWLQTEDHDFAEIAHTFLPGREKTERLVLTDDPSAARMPVADRRLGPEISSLVTRLAEGLMNLPYAKEVVELTDRFYRPGVFLAQAFASTLAALFAEDGLLILNPRHPKVIRLMVPVMRQALLDADKIEKKLEERGRALDEQGFKQQIRLRKGSPLFFFHHRDGARHRLQAAAGGYQSANGEVLSREDLLRLLEEEPHRFSTSALLRPLVQDRLLPTAAYVGGPAELDYYVQAAPLYEEFHCSPPMLVHRAQARLLTPPVMRSLKQLGLIPADLDQLGDAVKLALQKQASPPSDQNVPSQRWAAELNARLERLMAEAGDPILKRAAAKTQESVARALARLIDHYQRLEREQGKTIAGRMLRARVWLRPNDQPQERVYGFAPFAARVGLKAFHDAILKAVVPLDPAIKDIAL
jgi:bacillithiol biosynthesis cysteine-adding enzyme BshC